MCAELGCPNLIALPGERRGMSREEGADNAVAMLNRVKGYAEQKGITLCMEITNSKVVADQRTDQVFDRLEWGLDVCRHHSPRVKIVYDIYHVQIANGDVHAQHARQPRLHLLHPRRRGPQPSGDRRHAGAQPPLHRQRDRRYRLHRLRRPRVAARAWSRRGKSLEQCFAIMNV